MTFIDEASSQLLCWNPLKTKQRGATIMSTKISPSTQYTKGKQLNKTTNVVRVSGGSGRGRARVAARLPVRVGALGEQTVS